MRKIVVIIGFAFIASGVNAQTFDFGLNLGTTVSHLSSILPIPDQAGFDYSVGGYYRQGINDRYSWRVGANTGFEHTTFSPNRVDAFGVMEFYFMPQSAMEGGRKIVPYIALGLGYFVDFNERKDALDRRDAYMIQYNLTHKQDYLDKANSLMARYWLRNVMMPFNIGIRYTPTSKVSISLEWALRKSIQMNYNTTADPAYSPLTTNWRSYFTVTVGALFSNYCRTCPFYENLRKRRK